MTDHWTGAIRRAATQDDSGYCRTCLVEDGTDADALETYGTYPVAADRAAQDTRTLQDTLHVFGWVCEDHDTLCVRDPWDFEPPIDGLLTVALLSAQDGEITAHIPVHDLERDRERYYHPDNEDLQHPDVGESDTPDDTPEGVVELGENNAPRTCHACGGAAAAYHVDSATFFCKQSDCRPAPLTSKSER